VPGDALDLTIAPPGTPEVDVEPGADDELLDYELNDGAPVAVVTEAQVRDILDGAGRALSVPPLNMGVPELWKFSKDELDGLTPPLTRVVNKRPPLARAVAKGDEVFVLLQLAAYLGKRGDLLVESRRMAREEAPADVGQREAGPVVARAHAPTQPSARGTAAVGAHVDRSPAPEL
jgi:hypothetical protein